MLALTFIRANPELVREGARRKGEPAPIDRILSLDERHRSLLTEEERLRQELNQASARLAREREGLAEARGGLAALKERVQAIQEERRRLSQELEDLLLLVPNVPHESVPDGSTDEENVVVRTGGELPEFDFTPKSHYELGEALGILDFERAVKIAGSRFALLKGDGARLERALAQFMLDSAHERGYTEISPPYMVTRDCMTGTANLPKFEDDAFHVLEGDRFLIPTAEVPLTNLFRGELLDALDLPVRLCACTPCWRSEAGAPGKDTRGYIRLHQFTKVELVKFVRPEGSLEELESLVADAEAVLQALGLHYRVRLMCAGDMGFAQWKKYDIDAYAPGLKRFLEVSSCSVFADFQARRAGVRFREAKGKPEHVHTLNGSALALPRTFDCVVETYQTERGTIRVPETLQPYLHGLQELV